MALYKDTGEFFAIRLPHVPQDFAEELDREMEAHQGSIKIKEALFSGFRWVSMDVVKRVLPRKKK